MNHNLCEGASDSATSLSSPATPTFGKFPPTPHPQRLVQYELLHAMFHLSNPRTHQRKKPPVLKGTVLVLNLMMGRLC